MLLWYLSPIYGGGGGGGGCAGSAAVLPPSKFQFVVVMRFFITGPLLSVLSSCAAEVGFELSRNDSFSLDGVTRIMLIIVNTTVPT